MPIHLEVHTDPPFIEAVYSGPVSMDEMRATVLEAPSIARKYGTHLRLADFTSLTTELSIVNMYTMASWLASDRSAPSIREAIVLPDRPLAGEAMRFWETVAANRGLTVRAFRDRESALAWLFEKTDG